MTDLEQQLRDELREAERWAPVAAGLPPDLAARVRRRRRQAAALPALAVAALVVGAAAFMPLRETRDNVAAGPGVAGFGEPAALAVSAEALPESPLGARKQASAVWTGTEFLVWGGYRGRSHFGDGAANDLAARTWRALPAGPLGPVSSHAAVWTGGEMVVVAETSAAAYDPARRTWRLLAAPPIANVEGEAVLVNGFVVLGAYSGPSGANQGRLLVYELDADRWTVIDTGDTVYDLAGADGAVVLAAQSLFSGGRDPLFKYVTIPDGHVQVLPPLPGRGRDLFSSGVAWTGSRVVAIATRERTAIGTWQPDAKGWEETTTVDDDDLQAPPPPGGITIEWRDGWLVSTGAIGVYVVAPATGRAATMTQELRRVCAGDAAVAASPDALFVWGGAQCSAASPNVTGAEGSGTLVHLQLRTAGRD